jgi:hypothetical protein
VAGQSFAGANVSGFFFVSMQVLDHSGQPISQISQSTQGARHVVTVENISGLTQNALVKVMLPHKRRRIEFLDPASNLAIDQWSESAMGIPVFSKVDVERPLQRNSGSNHPSEPIRCVDVQDAQGAMAWSPGTTGVPFQITIDAA